MFIRSPCSKHLPNGRQNDISGGLWGAKLSPRRAVGVFGESWVSIGPRGNSRRDFDRVESQIFRPEPFWLGPLVSFWATLARFPGAPGHRFALKSHFESDRVFFEIWRAAYTGSSFSCFGLPLWMPKHVTDQSLARCSIVSCPKGVPVAMSRQ